MKACAYVRVSTADQAREGVSLDVQRERVAAYCAMRGLDLLHVYADEGISAKRADNRPGLQQALKHVCREKGVLVVYSLSRFARSVKDCITLTERLQKCGAQFVSLTEQIDTTSAAGRLFFTMLAAFAQFEREIIGERVSGAMQLCRRQNRRISRHVPYGYRVTDSGLVEVEAERDVIEQMKRWAAEGKGVKAIATCLNHSLTRPRDGVMWYPSTVRGILNREKKLLAGANT